MGKLIRNWTYLLFSDVSQAVTNFFVFMLLARKLSPAGYGDFNVVLALVTIFSVFAVNFGANHVVTREVTLHPETTKNLFLHLIPIRIASYFLTSLAVIIYSNIDKVENPSIILFSILLVLANSVWDLSESIAFGRFVTRFTTIFSFSFSIIWLIIVFILPETRISVHKVLIIYTGIYIIRALAYFITCYRKYISTGTLDISLGIKPILIMSLPYLWMRAVGALTEQIPVLLLDKRSGNDEVGYFAVGFRLIIPITLAISTGLRAVFPFLTKLYFEDREEFNRKLVNGFSFVLIWGTIAATILVITSKFWIPFILGAAYLKAVSAFSILAWFGVGLCFDLILSTVLSSTYQQKTLAIVTTIDFVVMFPILYLGARFGATGLASAKLIGMLIVIFYHIVVVVMLLKIKINNSSFYTSFLFYLVMMTVNLFITSWPVRILFILLTLLLYCLFKQSPLRQNLQFIMNKIKPLKGRIKISIKELLK